MCSRNPKISSRYYNGQKMKTWWCKSRQKCGYFTLSYIEIGKKPLGVVKFPGFPAPSSFFLPALLWASQDSLWRTRLSHCPTFQKSTAIFYLIRAQYETSRPTASKMSYSSPVLLMFHPDSGFANVDVADNQLLLSNVLKTLALINLFAILY